MPNELYIQWLKEWMDKAYDLQSKGYQTLRKAHESMKACPIDIGHPSQAAQLHGIGPVLCARLEKCLIAHCKANDLPMPQRPMEKRSDDSGEGDMAPARKKRAVKAYVPAYRGGSYAILMGLTDPAARDSMAKSDLIRLAQSHCDTSFEVAADQRGYYTAWTSMKTLLEKDLVQKRGSPPKYSITDAGAEVAERLRAAAIPGTQSAAQDIPTTVIELPSTHSDAATRVTTMEDVVPRNVVAPLDVTTPFDPILVPAGTFKIQLVIDNREVKSAKDRAFIDDQLFRAGIELTARTLEVGDALWIAKCNDGREFVLDHIVERKRMDDLVHSIKDGRFYEQKFRLKRCGARNVIFVIEESNLQDVISYQEAIQTAISSTQVVNGFFVKRVQSLDYTIRYLVRLNRKLAQLYESQDLHVIPDHMIDTRNFSALLEHLNNKHPGRKFYMSYEAFSGLTVKSVNLQIGDVWLRMLMTIRGVSTEKAVEIQSRFPTLQHLLKAYDACPDQVAREKMMNVHCCGYGRRQIGVALSKKIASIFA